MTVEDFPKKEDPNWFPVVITEFVVISIINAITIIAFIKNRHLRKRSTYLIMNLTVADLLVGVVTGPVIVYLERQDCGWPGLIICAIGNSFPIASQVNLFLISLERLHATLFPFRHCLTMKWVYFKIIIASWLISFSLAFVMVNLTQEAIQYAWASFSDVTLLVLTVSYIIIFINVQSNPYSQHHGSVGKERKLSVTLFIVTGVSILTILPMAILNSLPEGIKQKWLNASSVYLHKTLAVIYFANSIVNPLVYAIRMQEFRKAFVNLVSRPSQADKRQQAGAEQKRCHRSQTQTVL